MPVRVLSRILNIRPSAQEKGRPPAQKRRALRNNAARVDKVCFGKNKAVKADQGCAADPGIEVFQIAGGSGCGLKPWIAKGLTQAWLAAMPPVTRSISASFRTRAVSTSDVMFVAMISPGLPALNGALAVRRRFRPPGSRDRALNAVPV